MKRFAPPTLFLAAAMALSAPTQAAEGPFEPSLLRLSEVLGSLHYLDGLCGKPNPQWRELMEKLLAAEAPDDERRARFIARFNRGYRSFASVYSGCTPSAEAAMARYRQEGEELASQTAARFGN